MAVAVNDQFQEYYFQKLWAMIPDIYRFNDGLSENKDVLRSIVEVIAEQAANLRRSNDRLWEDQFIDLCDNWAVPYIGQLVGTRLLSAQNTRGRRIDVAKTIFYRRRSGTLSILEQIIADVTGWDGKVVENFKLLARARHGLDAEPTALAGRLTGTMPGGVADLRRVAGSELANTTFDEYFHTPDVRQHNGINGRYGIPKLAFHLYRLAVYQVEQSTPFSIDGTSITSGTSFTFDPSGRCIPLFSRRNRTSAAADWDQWHSALEWELPAPIRCRLLGDSAYMITPEVINALTINENPAINNAQSLKLQTLTNLQFNSDSEFLSALASLGDSTLKLFYSALLKYSLIDACGKSQLLPSAVAEGVSTAKGFIEVITGNTQNSNGVITDNIITAENILAGNLASPRTFTDNLHSLVIDAPEGKFQLQTAPNINTLSVTYFYGFSGPLGAGSYIRGGLNGPVSNGIDGGIGLVVADFAANSIVQINDNKTYIYNNSEPSVIPVVSLTFQAAEQMRPYIRLATDLIFDSGIDNPNAQLILDGLWIGATGDGIYNVIIRGNYQSVIIRNCTLDPGGSRNAKGEALNYVSLLIQPEISTQPSSIQQLSIENSIAGPISVLPGALVENFSVCNSIIQSVNVPPPPPPATPPLLPPPPLPPALNLSNGILTISRSTIFGKVNAERLNVSESIITDTVTAMDNQYGCFRFSAAPLGSRIPQPYKSLIFTGDTNSWFNSTVFGQPAYAQLSDIAPSQLVSGAENTSEMGGFCSLINPIKMADLITKVEEYMPFGLIPIFINET